MATLYQRGTPKALELAAAARWGQPGKQHMYSATPPEGQADGSSVKHHISSALHAKLDVLVVQHRRPHPKGPDDPLRDKFCWSRNKTDANERKLPHKPDFNTSYLVEKLGFHHQRRSGVVLHMPTGSRDPPFILALFVTGADMPELLTVAKKHPDLHLALGKVYKTNPDRPGLFMTGVRANDNAAMNVGGVSIELQRPPPQEVGYYATKPGKAHLLDPSASGNVCEQVRKSARGMCEVEALVSPHIGLLRASVTPCQHHPGILPSIPASECSAFAIAVSKGFIGTLHVDDTYSGLTETIVWNTEGVPKGSQLSFCAWDAEVCFDLQAGGASHACMIMIPGHVAHGTPDLGAAGRKSLGAGNSHNAYGAVIITKADLGKDLSQLNNLRSRMESDVFKARVPQKLLFTSRSPYYCPDCRPDALCGSCSRLYPAPEDTKIDAVHPPEGLGITLSVAGGVRSVSHVIDYWVRGIFGGYRKRGHETENAAVMFSPGTGRLLPLTVDNTGPKRYCTWRRATAADTGLKPNLETYVRLDVSSLSPPQQQQQQQQTSPKSRRTTATMRGTLAMGGARAGGAALGTNYVKWRQLAQFTGDELRRAVQGLVVELVPDPDQLGGDEDSSCTEAGSDLEVEVVSWNGGGGRGRAAVVGSMQQRTVDAGGQEDAGEDGEEEEEAEEEGQAGEEEGGESDEDALSGQEDEQEGADDEESEQDDDVQERGEHQAAPSISNGRTQVWWSPFYNKFYTSRKVGQSDLKEVGWRVAQAVHPKAPLGAQCVTGFVYFDGASRRSVELTLDDLTSLQYRGAVQRMFDAVPQWMQGRSAWSPEVAHRMTGAAGEAVLVGEQRGASDNSLAAPAGGRSAAAAAAAAVAAEAAEAAVAAEVVARKGAAATAAQVAGRQRSIFKRAAGVPPQLPTGGSQESGGSGKRQRRADGSSHNPGQDGLSAVDDGSGPTGSQTWDRGRLGQQVGGSATGKKVMSDGAQAGSREGGGLGVVPVAGAATVRAHGGNVSKAGVHTRSMLRNARRRGESSVGKGTYACPMVIPTDSESDGEDQRMQEAQGEKHGEEGPAQALGQGQEQGHGHRQLTQLTLAQCWGEKGMAKTGGRRVTVKVPPLEVLASLAAGAAGLPGLDVQKTEELVAPAAKVDGPLAVLSEFEQVEAGNLSDGELVLQLSEGED